MSLGHSVSQWIAELKEGEAEAAQKLWDRYAVKLVELARRRLGNAPKVMADEEDVAQGIFHSLCRGAAAGRFFDVTNRDDLWWLLLAITNQKVIDHVRRESAKKRGSGKVQSESALNVSESRGFSLDMLVGKEPTPDYLMILEEQHRRLLEILREDSLRSIAISRIEGRTVSEIADDLEVSTRSVQRKLRLIRSTWEKEMDIA